MRLKSNAKVESTTAIAVWIIVRIIRIHITVTATVTEVVWVVVWISVWVVVPCIFTTATFFLIFILVAFTFNLVSKVTEDEVDKLIFAYRTFECCKP